MFTGSRIFHNAEYFFMSDKVPWCDENKKLTNCFMVWFNLICYCGNTIKLGIPYCNLIFKTHTHILQYAQNKINFLFALRERERDSERVGDGNVLTRTCWYNFNLEDYGRQQFVHTNQLCILQDRFSIAELQNQLNVCEGSYCLEDTIGYLFGKWYILCLQAAIVM